MSEFPQWPAIRHGPKGEAKVFNSAAEVPAGWTETQNPDYPKPMDGERGPLPAHIRNQGQAAHHPLDHDKDGEKGGDVPDSPPALTGLNKAELREIAEAEGVEVADDATNAELREAIEAKRG